MNSSTWGALVIPALATIRPVFAAQVVEPSAEIPPAHPTFRLFRYDEDYSALADPRLRTDLFDPIKYVPLSATDPKTYLSFGGELRLQPESYAPPDLGTTPVAHDDYLLTRIEVHADAHFSRHLRAFAELIDGVASGAEVEPPPNQEDGVDLQQGFVDFGDRDESGTSWFVRTGRMEMGFGSYRLV